jgi:hypothetical protein
LFLKVKRGASAIEETICALNKTSKILETQQSTGNKMLQIINLKKRQHKLTKNISVIVAFFIFCKVPLHIANFITAICKECITSESLIRSFIVLSHLTSAVNPFLYAGYLKVSLSKILIFLRNKSLVFVLKDFRAALAQIFNCEKENKERKMSRFSSSQMQNQITPDISQIMKNQLRTKVDLHLSKQQTKELEMQSEVVESENL